MPLPRRRLLQLLPAGIAVAVAPYPLLRTALGAATASPGGLPVAADDTFGMEFDEELRTRLVFRGAPVTRFAASEALRHADGVIDRFALADSGETLGTDRFGEPIPVSAGLFGFELAVGQRVPRGGRTEIALAN